MSEKSDSGDLDSRGRVHLEWMFENRPEFLRELSRSGKLRQHLDEKNQQALRLVDILKQERGMTEHEAFEIAMSAVLAPPDGPAMSENPPEPVPRSEQEAIFRALCQP